MGPMKAAPRGRSASPTETTPRPQPRASLIAGVYNAESEALDAAGCDVAEKAGDDYVPTIEEPGFLHWEHLVRKMERPTLLYP